MKRTALAPCACEVAGVGGALCSSRGPAPAQTCSSPSGWLRGGLALQVVCRGVAWLVDRQISAARELNRGEPTPAFVTDRVGDRDAPGAQVRQRLLDVVAQQVEVVLPRPVSGVYGDLGWRQLEDQPATADVNPRKSEHVADEDPVGLRVGAVEDDMCSVDQVAPRSVEATQESRSRMSISHSLHEWLVRCSRGRVNPGMAWPGTQEVRNPPHGYRAEWYRHAEQGASLWFDAQQCCRADARPIIPGGRPTGFLGSGEIQCQKLEKSARGRAECGV
jgi:hypothetical protein